MPDFRILADSASAERRSTQRAVLEFRAMALLACSLTRSTRERLNEDLGSIPCLSSDSLRELKTRVLEAHSKMREDIGALKSPAEYLALIEEMEHQSEPAAFLLKHSIEQKYFSRIGARVPDWNSYPPHARLMIDFRGLMPNGLEYRLLEASLFESAALLWNDTVDASVHIRTAMGDDKIPGKRFEELKRSTVRAIYALIEGYLNGIAFDVILTADVDSLSKNERELILETSENGQSKWKTLREKILGYPRIAVALKHSPVKEKNPHVDYVLKHERELRDAFVHPTPRNASGITVLREQIYYNSSINSVGDLFDHTIGLIRYLDSLLDGKFGHAEFWLRNRESNGKFANETFH